MAQREDERFGDSLRDRVSRDLFYDLLVAGEVHAVDGIRRFPSPTSRRVPSAGFDPSSTSSLYVEPTRVITYFVASLRESRSRRMRIPLRLSSSFRQ